MIDIRKLDPSKPYIVSLSADLGQEDLEAIKTKLKELGINALVIATPIETVGTPGQSVGQWLRDYAAENERASRDAFWPWTKSRYAARAAAFREALRLVWSNT